MTVIWVLVIVMFGSGTAVDHINMDSKDACAIAARQVSEISQLNAYCLNVVTGELAR